MALLNPNRLREKKHYINDLIYITKFLQPYKKIKIPKFHKIIINCNFSPIDFNKKRIAPFLLIIEILTNQISLTKKTLQLDKITYSKKQIY